MTVNAAQSVAGTNQATAAAMIGDHVQVVTASSGQGLVLKPGNAGDICTIANASNVAIAVYPQVGASFNAGSVNIPASLPPSGALMSACIDAFTYNIILS